jgi:hypothetical protein
MRGSVALSPLLFSSSALVIAYLLVDLPRRLGGTDPAG